MELYTLKILIFPKRKNETFVENKFGYLFVVGEMTDIPQVGGAEVDEFRYVIVDKNGNENELNGGYRHF